LKGSLAHPNASAARDLELVFTPSLGVKTSFCRIFYRRVAEGSENGPMPLNELAGSFQPKRR
jgi:hypothetical protein